MKPEIIVISQQNAKVTNKKTLLTIRFLIAFGKPKIVEKLFKITKNNLRKLTFYISEILYCFSIIVVISSILKKISYIKENTLTCLK
jgi:hypothetical protein